MVKEFHPTLYKGCDYFSILGLKSIHVSKRDLCEQQYHRQIQRWMTISLKLCSRIPTHLHMHGLLLLNQLHELINVHELSAAFVKTTGIFSITLFHERILSSTLLFFSLFYTKLMKALNVSKIECKHSSALEPKCIWCMVNFDRCSKQYFVIPRFIRKNHKGSAYITIRLSLEWRHASVGVF